MASLSVRGALQHLVPWVRELTGAGRAGLLGLIGLGVLVVLCFWNKSWTAKPVATPSREVEVAAKVGDEQALLSVHVAVDKPPQASVPPLPLPAPVLPPGATLLFPSTHGHNMGSIPPLMGSVPPMLAGMTPMPPAPLFSLHYGSA